MLASRNLFEQSSAELTQVSKPLVDISANRICHVNNIALHGAEDIIATIHDASSSERIKLEQFVKALFKSKHGANIQYFMPDLMALSLRNGPLMAVCGLRKANQGPLFLERYLASSIEKTISDIAGETISRSAITEIGNLAVAQPEYVRCLLASINLHLHKTDTDWAVFTGIRTLKNALIKLNIPLLSLGMAHIGAIPQEAQSDWGSYYDEKPEVMAIKRNFLVR
jgi:hypothetical protein